MTRIKSVYLGLLLVLGAGALWREISSRNAVRGADQPAVLLRRRVARQRSGKA